ncbi:hypothetical protein [Salinicola tamaricis]|uniref:hypothetical protein n=1 Tax=Salinicola tamaricis TaxID=1771309 RepID=UPI0030F4885D
MLLLPVATMVTVLGTQKIIGVFDHADTAQTPISVASTATLSQSIIASAGNHDSAMGHDKAGESSTLQRLSDDIPLAQLKPLEVMDVDLIPQAQASEDVPAASAATGAGSATAPPLLAATALKSALALGASGHDFAANSDSDDDIGGTSYEDWTSDGMLDPSGDPELGSEIASHEQYVPEWQSYTIQPGDSFALTAERTLGLEYSDVTQILGAVPDKKVLTRWRVGRTFDYKLDENGQLLALRVMKNPRDGYLIERDSETAEFAYAPIEKAGEATQRMFSGTVSGSFALSAQSTGLSSAEVSELTHVLSKKLDFRRDARAGDHFQVLVESDMIDGQSLDSKILAAKYEGQRMDLTVVRTAPTITSIPRTATVSIPPSTATPSRVTTASARRSTCVGTIRSPVGSARTRAPTSPCVAVPRSMPPPTAGSKRWSTTRSPASTS